MTERSERPASSFDALARALGYPDDDAMRADAARMIDERDRRLYSTAWWNPAVSDTALAAMPGAR